ncbi:hypothetical protein AB4Y89_24180, partial [Terriglobus sp. 2YAB30_2]|uniref:hypothetical protein n=1 Tax=Terriglobus sp. 2YAB30_2 TaxID=3233023 RepID=UPI003F9599F6
SPAKTTPSDTTKKMSRRKPDKTTPSRRHKEIQQLRPTQQREDPSLTQTLQPTVYPLYKKWALALGLFCLEEQKARG